jgi:hypothetical protein
MRSLTHTSPLGRLQRAVASAFHKRRVSNTPRSYASATTNGRSRRMTGEGVPSEFAFIERRMHGRVKGLARNSRSRRSHQKQLFLTRGATSQSTQIRAVNRRRGCCVCRANNCRRRARFSRTRSSRERKALTNQPRKCRSGTIMARILTEKSESSLSPSHSFCKCTTFWPAVSEGWRNGS